MYTFQDGWMSLHWEMFAFKTNSAEFARFQEYFLLEKVLLILSSILILYLQKDIASAGNMERKKRSRSSTVRK